MKNLHLLFGIFAGATVADTWGLPRSFSSFGQHPWHAWVLFGCGLLLFAITRIYAKRHKVVESPIKPFLMVLCGVLLGAGAVDNIIHTWGKPYDFSLLTHVPWHGWVLFWSGFILFIAIDIYDKNTKRELQ